jgi:Methyltransferase domain
MQDRRHRLLGDIDFQSSRGVEVGALHAPIVSKSDGPVIYVDYAPTETLRANLRHPGVRPSDVVEVDVVWGERPLREQIGEPVDYVVASHVIEHVPDVIGWLLELHDAMKPDGTLGLAVPDRRYTFDIYRPSSGLGEMIEAHLRGYRRPSLRQVFESAAFSRNSPDTEAWRPDHRGAASLPQEVLQRLPEVYQWMKNDIASSSRYIDAHCWVFTPASFLDTAEALTRIGCFPFRIAGFFPTEAGSIEFHVRLNAMTYSGDPVIVNSIAAARQALPPGGALEDRIADLEQQNRDLTAALERQGRT